MGSCGNIMLYPIQTWTIRGGQLWQCHVMSHPNMNYQGWAVVVMSYPIQTWTIRGGQLWQCHVYIPSKHELSGVGSCSNVMLYCIQTGTLIRGGQLWQCHVISHPNMNSNQGWAVVAMPCSVHYLVARLLRDVQSVLSHFAHLILIIIKLILHFVNTLMVKTEDLYSASLGITYKYEY